MKWLRAQAASERLTRELGAMADRYLAALQPTANALGDALGLSPESTCIFAEEVIRGSPAAPLAQLVAILAPKLRQMAGMSSWEVISPASGIALFRKSDGSMRLQKQQTEPCWCTSHTKFNYRAIGLVLHVSGPQSLAQILHEASPGRS